MAPEKQVQLAQDDPDLQYGRYQATRLDLANEQTEQKLVLRSPVLSYFFRLYRAPSNVARTSFGLQQATYRSLFFKE